MVTTSAQNGNNNKNTGKWQKHDIGTKWEENNNKKTQGNGGNEKLKGTNARGRVTGHFFGAKIAFVTGLPAGTYILSSDSTTQRPRTTQTAFDLLPHSFRSVQL